MRHERTWSARLLAGVGAALLAGVLVSRVMAGRSLPGEGAASEGCADERIQVVPFALLDPQTPGQHLQVNFPDRARAGRARASYWLCGSDDLVIDVQVAIGPGATKFPAQLHAALFLDGEQRRVQKDEGVGADLKITLATAGQVARRRVRMAGAEIGEGAHSASLVLWREDAVPYPGWSFIVYKESRDFAAAPASDVFQVTTSARPGLGGVWTAEATPRMLFGRSSGVRPDERGGLALDVLFGREDRHEAPVSFVVVALLDGLQIDLGKAGRHPRAGLLAGQATSSRVRLTALPSDGKPHFLQVFAIGHGEEPDARSTPWLAPRQLGWASWL